MTFKSNPNWRRGLFRLWVVVSLVFVIAVAAISYSEIKAQFDSIALMKWADENSVRVVPVLCGEARGIAGTDFTTKSGQDPGPWDRYANPNPFDNCWYAMPKFRRLYPEYNDLSDKELSSKLYAKHGIPLHDLPNPWTTTLRYSAIAFGIPLALLVLGTALGWAFSGFAAKHQ